MAVRLLDRTFFVALGLLILFAVTGCELRKSLDQQEWALRAVWFPWSQSK